VEAAPTVDNEKSQAASEGARKTVPAPAETVAPATETPGKPAGGAEVVRLDRFRKK
jgi:hypothetical protein